MNWLDYLLGLLTIPSALMAWALWEWLTDKNFRIDCLRCERAFGEIGEDYKIVQQIRFRLHRRECKRLHP